MSRSSRNLLKNKWVMPTVAAVVVVLGASYLWYQSSLSREANASDSIALRSGLIAHWKLDSQRDSVAVDEVSGYDGTFVGDPAWTAGKSGSGVAFDGEHDEITFSPITLGNGTISAWVLWNKKSALLAGNSYEEGYWLLFEPERESVNLNWGGKHVRLPDVFEEGVWTHVAMTRRDSVLTLYKNGVLQAAFEHGATAPAVIRSIGAVYAGNGSYQRFDGVLDDLRIYERALSASEIRNLYTAL